MAVYRQSVRHCAKPLEAHDQSFYFLHLNPYGHNPCVTSSDEKMAVSLMNMLGLCEVYMSHIWHVIENSSFYNIYKSCISSGFAMQIMPILFTLYYNGSVVT
jgi:hypothetical protein